MDKILREPTKAVRSYGLDLMRAIAISLVLLAHFAQKIEFLGFWGVELFFALSGFLIGNILWRSFSQTESWSFAYLFNFWKRRWWRTLPNYYLFLIVSLVFSYLVYASIPEVNEFVHYLYFGQNLFTPNGTFFGVSWSLCIEEWFYLSFPLLLFILSFFKMKKVMCYGITLSVYIIGALSMRYYFGGLYEDVALRGITLARLDAIAYGVLAAFITSQIQPGKFAALIAFGIGVLLISSPGIIAVLKNVTYHEMNYNPVYLATVPLGASFMIPFMNTLKKPKRLFRFMAKPIYNFSLWSYSIYLSHIPFLYLGYYLLDDYRTSFVGNLLSKFFGLILTVFFSALIFKYFETPFTKKRPKELKPGTQINYRSEKDSIEKIPPL